MHLKISHKLNRVFSAGDINSPNLLVHNDFWCISEIQFIICSKMLSKRRFICFLSDHMMTGSVPYVLLMSTSFDNVSTDNFSTNSTEMPPETDNPYQEFYDISQRITGLILYPAVCIPGFVANILLLIVLSQENMRTSTNAFLSALAVSDSIKLANDIVYFIVIVLKEYRPLQANVAYGHFYPYAHFIFNFAVCISSWLTVSVAVERFIMVCHPTRAITLCSRSRAIVTSACVYLIMTLIALPSAFRYRKIQVSVPGENITVYDIELTDLWKDETFVTAYTWTLNMIRCNIPLIVLIVLNICIINDLRKTRANKKFKSRNRITIMLLMVIVVFLVGIFPDAIMSTFLKQGYHEANLLVKGIREYTDWLLALSAAVNFIIYCACNSIFRQTFIMVFCGKAGKVAQVDETKYRKLSIQNASPETRSNNTAM